MIDVFAVAKMTRATHPASSPASSTPPPPADPGSVGHVCPFCGLTREITETFDPTAPCPRCTLADNPTTRNATRARVGPWFVRQVRNPWAPGMRFETLLALIKRGQVTRDSIVRGPTTYQLWKRALTIRGLSREFGLCHSCGAEIGTQATLCPNCNRLQEPPTNPDMFVDTREPPALAPAPLPAAPVAPPTARVSPERPVSPFASGPVAADEAPHLEMSSGPIGDADDLLAVSEDQAELARQITSRPPVVPPVVPPVTTPRVEKPGPANSGLANSGLANSRSRNIIRPRQPGADDALLTPQELAQAFQLDFGPGAGVARSSRRKLIAGVLFFIAAGVVTLICLRPDLRARGWKWGEETLASVKAFIVSRTSPSASPPAATRPTGVAPGAQLPRSRVSAPVVIAPPPASAARPVVVSDDSAKALQTPIVPRKSESAQIATDIVHADPPVPAPAPAPAKQEKHTPPPKVAEPAPTLTYEQAYEQARTLWGNAIDAEANQDYVEAVRCYEQIKKLPADVHPRGLDVHLELARKLTK